MQNNINISLYNELVDWQFLCELFKERKLDLLDLENYAAECLVSSDDNDIALLASANSLDDVDVLNSLNRLADKEHELMKSEKYLDKKKLFILKTLSSMNESDDYKLDVLQQVYADFDYPEEMREFSIYENTSTPPLIALERVISDLEKKLT